MDDNLAFGRNRLLKSEADLPSLLDLYEKVRGGRQRVRDEETNPQISILKLSGVVRVMGGYLWVRKRIYARVFNRHWVRENMPDAELRRQRAAYRRGLIRSAAIASVIVAVMAGLAFFAFDQAHQAVNERLKADEQRRETQRLLYIANMNLAHQARESNNPGRVLELLEETHPKPGEEDLREFEWRYPRRFYAPPR